MQQPYEACTVPYTLEYQAPTGQSSLSSLGAGGACRFNEDTRISVARILCSHETSTRHLLTVIYITHGDEIAYPPCLTVGDTA